MFKRIIVASEISPVALAMLDCLKDLRNLGASECILINCYNPYEATAAISDYIVRILKENLEKQKAVLVAQGYGVETRLVPGCIKSEINSMAEREECALIVTSAPEQSFISEYIVGGTAHEVIHSAIRPVLLLRRPEEPKEKGKTEAECRLTDHILFPTDFSENAASAFEYVVRMVENGAKKVTLAHVQDMVKISPHLMHKIEEFNEIDTDRLKVLKKILVDKGAAEVDIHLLYGSPAVELMNLIKEHKITLTVMGSQGRGFVNEFFLGSVSHNIARHSAASVLLVPALR